MLVISLVICALFTMEAFAAVNINLTLGGTVRYTAKDIGAEIAGTIKVNTNGTVGTEKYMTLSSQSGLGVTDSYGVFTIAGTGVNYSTQVVGDDETTFDVVTDTIDLYVFVRNRGSRPFMPTLAFEEGNGLIASVSEYYFTTSGTNPIALIRAGNTASQLNTAIDALTAGTDYLDFGSKVSLVHSETLFAKVTLSVDPNYELSVMGNVFDYLMEINIMLDVQYITDEDFLTVYQQNNIVDTTWTKLGHNATLSATAIKAGTNNITKLDNAYSAGLNNNADLTKISSSLTYDCDDYDDAVVYKDIDIVNVDIATGEIIGKLSDVNYPFEWYGGTVTLPSGTVLASGRELTSTQTFTVDVYTYYPTMYIRRWCVDNYTYISITDQPYTHYGFVKIDEHYVATCEAVTYNPDKSLAYNSYGIITRSYVNGFMPYAEGGNSYHETNSGFTNTSGFSSTVTANPSAMLGFSNNLTQAWQAYATNNPAMAQYTQGSVQGCSGQDWHEFVYRLLYIVKYANNDSQTTVGKGNVSSSTVYSNKGDYKNMFAERVGGTIGLYNSSAKTLSYANDNATPYYATDFLTYNKSGTNPRRYLRDGYVGSDGYTSVCCLGKFNPWGNIWEWVCGVATIEISNAIYCYVQFDEYDATSPNYYVADDGSGLSTLAAKETALNNMGYIKIPYTMPKSASYYRYLGCSAGTTSDASINALLTIVGVPTSASSTASNTTGLCAQQWTRNKTTCIYGLCVCAGADGGNNAGVFAFSTRNYADHKYSDIGYRTKLVSSSN